VEFVHYIKQVNNVITALCKYMAVGQYGQMKNIIIITIIIIIINIMVFTVILSSKCVF